MIRKIWIVSSIVFCIVILLHSFITSCSSPGKRGTDQDTVVMNGSRFVGGEQCKSCHDVEFSEWESSDHFKAMAHAVDSTVLGNFNNVTYIADGVTSRFFRRDGKYFINTQGEDGSNHDFEVLYTFGYYPLQQYLIAFPGGRLQLTRVSWDWESKRLVLSIKIQKLRARCLELNNQYLALYS